MHLQPVQIRWTAALLCASLWIACEQEPHAVDPTHAADMAASDMTPVTLTDGGEGVRDVPSDSVMDMPRDQDASRDEMSSPDASSSRRELSLERMQQGRLSHDNSPVSLLAFMPDGMSREEASPLGVSLVMAPMAYAIGVVRDDVGRGQRAEIAKPPVLRLDLVRREDGVLIPGARGFQATDGDESWWAMVGAGVSWREGEDRGRSRATLPLTLVEPFANCTFHGVLTFLYDDTQRTFSDAYYQISQETCLYFKANLWGWFDVTATAPVPSTTSELILADFTREEDARLPTRPLDTLDGLYDIPTSGFLRKVNAQHITTHGVVWNGVHYRGECRTRQGEHPLCEELVLPSYSTAKSAVASLAFLAMNKTRPDVGDTTMGEALPDVPESWGEVTLAALLDMRSGHYDSSFYMVDEDGERMLRFFLERGDEEKYQAALDFPAQPAESPWVYHTSDTFLATRVMQAVLAEDLFGWLVARVFEPLQLSLVARSASLRTEPADETSTSQHLGGYGSFWLPGDVAKLAEALHAHAHGERDDLFDVAQIAQVMQRSVEISGARAGAGLWYHRGFWALEVNQEMGFPCSHTIPFMSGFGGITVALLPNGATYYVFGDDNEFGWLDAARELARLGDFCTL